MLPELIALPEGALRKCGLRIWDSAAPIAHFAILGELFQVREVAWRDSELTS
jgi:hypothetical protein